MHCFTGECVDMRKEPCYMNWSRWSCSTPMSQNQTKKVCCCSMGQGWGVDCQRCPQAGNSRYKLHIYTYK